MSARDELKELLIPILDVVRTLDLTRPADAERTLAERFPAASLEAVRAKFREGVAAGALCEKENDGVKFSRVAKDLGGWSIDVVHMRGPGASHTHPNGEVDLCFAVEGSPQFDGRGVGFTVYPPGSWHTPTVSDGVMDIVYFLPGGAIVFGPAT